MKICQLRRDLQFKGTIQRGRRRIEQVLNCGKMGKHRQNNCTGLSNTRLTEGQILGAKQPKDPGDQLNNEEEYQGSQRAGRSLESVGNKLYDKSW